MDTANAVRPDENLDWQTLEPYLREHLPETTGTMTTAQFHGGHANLTYLIQFGETEYVLRRPPFGRIAPGAHDMKREFRVLSKLWQHFPAAPRAFHYCADADVIGAHFVVMERRRGIVVRYAVPPEFRGLENVEQRLTDALVDAVADLHKVDVGNAGLEKLGRPEGYTERQILGWQKRWELAKTEPNPTMDALADRLLRDVPEPQAVSIVHNDLKFDNCQFAPDDPDRVASVFDWDMTTLGDPLTDFGVTLGYWPDARLDARNVPVLLHGNFPGKDYLKRRYAERTGFDLSRMDWYEALSYSKAAIIAQQLYQRYVQGNSTDARMAKFGRAGRAFGEMARQLLEG